MGLALILFGPFPTQLQSGTTDGEPLVVEETANLPDQEHVMSLIIATIAPSLDRLELRELLFPVTQHMRLDPAEFTHFADGEITLPWNRRQITRAVILAVIDRFQHKLQPVV